MDDDFFAPPPFNAAEGLERLRRSLRELRGLRERAGTPLVYELAGQSVVELTLRPDAIETRLARQPARTPQWQARTLRNSADVRDFTETVRRHLAAWTDD
ncbi:MAG: hypothetical protein AB9M60_07625 [Leptothrix sp. (in: b-proteobacteria)]